MLVQGGQVPLTYHSEYDRHASHDNQPVEQMIELHDANLKQEYPIEEVDALVPALTPLFFEQL